MVFKHTVEIIGILSNILCWIHYYIVTGRKPDRVLLFFGGSIFLGTISEIAALVLTGSYDYPGFRWYIGPLPVFIAIGWGSTLYFGYMISNVIARPLEGRRLFYLYYGLIAGGIGLCIDLCYDPVAVMLGWWKWDKGSAYFGVPVANFIGWFVFTGGFCPAYRRIDSSQWSIAKKTGVLAIAILIVFIATALSSFPFI
jgi:uncharacterized membrane protein